MQDIKEKIHQKALELRDRLIQIRRHLHAHPELSFEEYQTSAFVQQVLDQYGLPYTTGWVKTGIVCTLEGKNPGKHLIALRADLDALPILEKNKVPYVSKNEGVMHACGHDVHTTCLLGACIILNELKENFEGTIRFIFQPGEEKLPGGAGLMIEQGVLKNPDVELIIGQHVFPEMETGKAGFRKGMYMASTDELHIYASGKGGHAALPHTYDYITMAAAEFMYQTDVRHQEMTAGKELPAVLAYGKMLANGTTNVIPAELKLEGTLRTLDSKHREQVHTMLLEEGKKMGKKYHCTFEVDIKKGYPVLYNHELLTGMCADIAGDYLGKENITELDLRMTAEDFAFYSQEVPACFFRLGTGNVSKNIVSSVHTATFDIDEEALIHGSGLMAYLAYRILHQFPPLPAK